MNIPGVYCEKLLSPASMLPLRQGLIPMRQMHDRVQFLARDTGGGIAREG